VHGLRQKRCGPGDRERDELGDRDAQVCGESSDYRSLAAVPAITVTAVSAAASAPGSGLELSDD
jgi:hypothetical protein